MREAGEPEKERRPRKAEKRAAPPKQAREGGKKGKGKKRAPAGSGLTFIRLGRGLHRGGLTITRYTKQAVKTFNRYTQGDFAERDDGLFRQLNRLRRIKFSTFLLAVAVVLFVAVMLLSNSSIELQTATVSVAGLHADLEGYTILLLSDLHGREFSANQATLLRAVNAQTYDLLVMTGDMVGAGGDSKPLLDLLAGLTQKKPVYFIAGDSDPGPLLAQERDVEGPLEQHVLEKWILDATAQGAIYLDSPRKLTVGAATIWLTPESMLSMDASATLSRLNAQLREETERMLAGDQEAYERLPFTNYLQECLQSALDAAGQMTDTDLHISLAHYPPTTEYLTAATDASQAEDAAYLRAVDLVLAGHYCGGVWKLPFFGALYIPAPEAARRGWFPDQADVEGLKLLGNISVYVSGGLGATDRIYLPPIRLSNQPKVTLLRLTSALTDDLLGVTY